MMRLLMSAAFQDRDTIDGSPGRSSAVGDIPGDAGESLEV